MDRTDQTLLGRIKEEVKQLPLLVPVEPAENLLEVSTNLALIKGAQLNHTFTVDFGSGSFEIGGSSLPEKNNWPLRFLLYLAGRRSVVTCTKCKKEEISFFMMCKCCGTYISCKRHFDPSHFWGHYGHYCSQACCEYSHPSNRYVTRERAELEAMLTYPEILIRPRSGSQFRITVRRKTEAEVDEYRQILSSFTTRR